MEPSATADPVAQAHVDRNRRSALFGLSAILAMTGAVLLKLDLLGKVGLGIGPGLAGNLVTGLLLAAGAEPLREVLKLGDRESKPPPQPTPIQLTGTVVLQHPLTIAVEKAPVDGVDARQG
jgi:hypothetical protein